MLRIVPWVSRNEWLETYENLYNFDDAEQQVKGLKRVEAWKSRSGNKLPLSIEATASLVTAGVEDVRSQVSQYVVRQTMAMVIVRFVNGMVDLEQKGAYARSVQSIADEIGLPDWLVDLRHEATHASLPSLEVLRAGCRFALDWLRDCYWESQIAEFRQRDETLLALLGKYAKLCEIGWSGEKMTKSSKNKETAEEIAELVGKYDMWESLLDLSFGEEGLLVPSFEILQEKFPETSMTTTDSSLELPKEIQQSLTPLLKVLHKANDKFLSNLVSFLVKRVHKLGQSSKNIPLVHFYSCWIHFILLNCSGKNKQKQWKIKAKLDYITLLEICLQNPSTYTSHLLPLIIENFKTLSDSIKDKLINFSAINVVFNRDNNSNKLSTQNETTVREILNEQFPLVARQVEAREIDPGELGNSVWQKCSPSFARSVPFGCFLGKELEIENLKQTNDELMQVETNFENDISEEQNGEETLDSEFDNADDPEIVENYLNEDENSGPSQASDVLAAKELTDVMIKDISKNIWIF